MPTLTPTTPPVNAVTTAHREELQRARAFSLDAFAVASALCEWLTATPGLDERQVALAFMAKRDAKRAFDAIHRLSTELDPEQTPVPEGAE